MIQRMRKIGPFVLFVLMGQVLLPFTFISQLWRTPHKDVLTWLLSLYLAGSCIALIYAVGAWSWLGRGTRYASPVLLAIVAVATCPYAHDERSISTFVTIDRIISLCVGSIFSVMLVPALIARNIRMPALELTFPLYGGTSFVAQGGNSRLAYGLEASTLLI